MSKIFYVKDYLIPHTTDSSAIERCFDAANQVNDEKTILFDAKIISLIEPF